MQYVFFSLKPTTVPRARVISDTVRQGIFLPESSFGADSLMVSVHPPVCNRMRYNLCVEDPVVLDINHPSLPSLFYSVLVSVSVFMAISTVFHSINSPDNCPLSHSVLLALFCLIGPFNYMSLYESVPQP